MSIQQLITKIPVARDAALGTRTLFRKKVVAPRRRKQFQSTSRRRIIIGTSGVTARGWIGTDIEYLNLLKESDWKYFFEPRSVDAILAEHVWEHLTAEQGVAAAAMCFNYLKSGGYVRAAVPDGSHPNSEYITRVKVNGSGEGASDHKILYTHRTFRQVFEATGFAVQLLEYFDEEGVFHRQDWQAEDGMIHRSLRFDERNADGKTNYTSIILDAWKP
jgi:predicted SAM-dependent methyltransferase